MDNILKIKTIECNECRYPSIELQATLLNGNACVLIWATINALRDAGISEREISAFTDEAHAGNYNDLLRTMMRWVSVS